MCPQKSHGTPGQDPIGDRTERRGHMVCHDGPTDCSHGLSTQKFLVPAGGTDRLNAETPHAVPTSPLAECNDQNGYHLPPKTANLVILRPNHACVCEVSEANVAQLTLSRSERSDRSAVVAPVDANSVRRRENPCPSQGKQRFRGCN